MIHADELAAILNHILVGEQTEAEIIKLRDSISMSGDRVQIAAQAEDQQDSQPIRQITIGQISGGEVHIGDKIYQGADAETIRSILQEVLQPLHKPTATGIPENLPRSGAVQFVGRTEVLEILHQQLQHPQQLITAIAGMGGIGKTELAVQYANQYKAEYPGGICWIHARGLEVGTQIVQFARSYLQLQPPEDLDLLAQVGFCWTHWPDGDTLILFDDVVKYAVIKPYLPPHDRRFKVICTTRLRLGKSVKQLEIEVLDEAASLALLNSLIGAERLQAETETAKQLCAWLGYLPLGIELVGRYLDRKPDWSIATMQQRLEKKRLAEKALQQPDEDMTAHTGVAAAFELSWETLSAAAQQMGLLLSLFALSPIPWSLVERCWTDVDPEELEELRDDYWINLHLLQRKGNQLYQFHQLMREFLQAKQQDYADLDELRQQFCRATVQAAVEIPEFLPLPIISTVAPTVPHIAEAAIALTATLPSADLVKPFIALGQFYKGQSFFSQAAQWYEQGWHQATQRLGHQHSDLALILTRLAGLYKIQGRYAEAEPLYQQALQIRLALSDREQPDSEQAGKQLEVALTLNELAILYTEQGRFAEAEPLLKQALSTRQTLLATDCPEIAESLAALAILYQYQEQFTKSEELYLRAAAIYQKTLGEEHELTIECFHNLSVVYAKQERFAEAVALTNRILERNRRLLGEEHLMVANNLNTLASLYTSLDRLSEAEPLLETALQGFVRCLGSDHPYVAFGLSNQAKLYAAQGRSAEAEAVYIRAIAILEAKFKADYADVIEIFQQQLHELQARMSEPQESEERMK
ncbi:MAG: tetratricopeptide repeat protein [Drouetiella hepatica Uher 2000/2452]|jgi:tetratricopeptide (TPR) repeat protein|uniref:Tetratricopeptide repeat protein n=1 Tax=Drouetiella hepatica Uher 2000/2452 TaxID=904376 RepID=A0A951UPL3_9CYAN|nr:tetratricopeptide repeat protein [Drouetiella hepatica Uher 2000/2452]